MASFLLDAQQMAAINKLMPKGFLIMTDSDAKKKIKSGPVAAKILAGPKLDSNSRTPQDNLSTSPIVNDAEQRKTRSPEAQIQKTLKPEILKPKPKPTISPDKGNPRHLEFRNLKPQNSVAPSPHLKPKASPTPQGFRPSSSPIQQSSSPEPSLPALAELIKQLPPKYLPGLRQLLLDFLPELEHSKIITFDLAECAPPLLAQIRSFVKDKLNLERLLQRRVRKDSTNKGEVQIEEIERVAKEPEKYLLGKEKIVEIEGVAAQVDERLKKTGTKTGLRSFSTESEGDHINLEKSDSSSSTSGNTPTKDRLKKRKHKLTSRKLKESFRTVDPLAPLPSATTIPNRSRPEVEARLRELEKLQASATTIKPEQYQPKMYIPESEEPSVINNRTESLEPDSKHVLPGTVSTIVDEAVNPSNSEPIAQLLTQPQIPTESKPRSSSANPSEDSSSFISTSD